LRSSWRRCFEQFSQSIDGENLYVTIDLDCLDVKEAVTNWEAGRFMAEDLQWALKKLRESSQIVGGDVCGAYSPPTYARYKQHFAAEFDHPRVQLPDPERIRQINLATLERVWPLLSRV
jgi:arginase family enzyme